MMLIILTEHEPLKAVERLLKTCTYIIVPLSVLFIKYYPTLGRGYSEWTGGAFYTGVTTNKNILGHDLLVCGLLLVWRLTARWRGKDDSGRWIDDIGIPILLLFMVGWLFEKSDSKTPLIGLILSILVFVALGRQSVRRHIGAYLVAGILTFVVLQVSVNITDTLITSAGRDTTLTGRTELWEVVLRMDPRPILGYGFESFWLGDRLKKLQDMYYFKPNQAHSGYIEMYLNLGWVGLLFLVGVIVSCYAKIREMLTSSSEMTKRVMFGTFGMAFLAAFLIYNYTEAAFKSLHFLFVIFLLFAIKYPSPQERLAQSSPATWLQGTRRVTGVKDLSFSLNVAPGAPRSLKRDVPI
jgi:O-antigen ligase